MSENDKQDLIENDWESDGEKTENLAVGTATSNNTVQASRSSSKIANHSLQQPKTEGAEVHPNDVIIIEQLSHESLGEGSSENLECKVTYEFPIEDESKNASFSERKEYKFTYEFPIEDERKNASFSERKECKVTYEFPIEDESKNASFSERKECKVTYEYLNGHEIENASHLSDAYVVPSHKTSQVSDHAEYRAVSYTTEKSKDKQIKVFNSKTLVQESTDNTATAGTSRKSGRKRKKGSTSLLQNKKQKKVESSNSPGTHPFDRRHIQQDEFSDHSSDGFADIEDNDKYSTSSENSDLNSTPETAKQMSVKNLDLGIPQSLFPSSMKGETIPVIKLSGDMKKKFEIPKPTGLEARELESDEQILQPKKSNSNPLKTSVIKIVNRCNVCNIRLGLCAIRCRCGGYYCANHRYDKEHNCTFDYKSMGAAEIEKNNPRIVAEKVRKL